MNNSAYNNNETMNLRKNQQRQVFFALLPLNRIGDPGRLGQLITQVLQVL